MFRFNLRTNIMSENFILFSTSKNNLIFTYIRDARSFGQINDNKYQTI